MAATDPTNNEIEELISNATGPLTERLNAEGGTGAVLMLVVVLPLFLGCSIGGERVRATQFSAAFKGGCGRAGCGVVNPTVWAARLNLTIVLNAVICGLVGFYAYAGATLSLVSCAVGYYGVCFNDWRMVLAYGWVATPVWFIVGCATLPALSRDILVCDLEPSTAWCGFLRFLFFVELAQLAQCAVGIFCCFRFLYWVYRRRRAAHGQGQFEAVDRINVDNNSSSGSSGSSSSGAAGGSGGLPAGKMKKMSMRPDGLRLAGNGGGDDDDDDLDDLDDEEEDFGRPAPRFQGQAVDDAFDDEYARPEPLPPLHLVLCEMIRNLAFAYNCGVVAAPAYGGTTAAAAASAGRRTGSMAAGGGGGGGGMGAGGDRREQTFATDLGPGAGGVQRRTSSTGMPGSTAGALDMYVDPQTGKPLTDAEVQLAVKRRQSAEVEATFDVGGGGGGGDSSRNLGEGESTAEVSVPVDDEAAGGLSPPIGGAVSTQALTGNSSGGNGSSSSSDSKREGGARGAESTRGGGGGGGGGGDNKPGPLPPPWQAVKAADGEVYYVSRTRARSCVYVLRLDFG